MNIIKGKRKRIEGILLICICLLSLFLIGCSKPELQDGVNFIFEKNGGVTVSIHSDFPVDYYDLSEFNKMNQEEVEAYNKKAGETAVEIISSETDGQKIFLTMHYKQLSDYCEMNQIEMFCGTVAEAVSKGYSLDGSYKKGSNFTEKQKLTQEDLKNYHVIIANDPVTIHTYKKIVFISENVTVSDNKKMATITGDDRAIIVFK